MNYIETQQWLEDIGKSIDSRNADEFVKYLTEDSVFRFGNQEPVKGKNAIRDYVAYFFSMIKGSEHKVLNFWEDDNSIVWQGQVNYTRLDNKKVTINFVNVFYMANGLVKEYLIYIDNAPLFG
jgi:ketosteroid isomerase-like protein